MDKHKINHNHKNPTPQHMHQSVEENENSRTDQKNLSVVSHHPNTLKNIVLIHLTYKILQTMK